MEDSTVRQHIVDRRQAPHRGPLQIGGIARLTAKSRRDRSRARQEHAIALISSPTTSDVTPAGAPAKVLDFGIAKLAAESSAAAQTPYRIAEGHAANTLSACTEQGGGPASDRSDGAPISSEGPCDCLSSSRTLHKPFRRASLFEPCCACT